MAKVRIEIKWALIFFFTSLAWVALERATGLHDEHLEKHPLLSNLFAIPAILIYVLALLEKRKVYYHQVMTYLEGLKSGLILTAFVAILSPLSTILTHKVISPGYFPNVISYVTERGMMTAEEAQSYFSISSYLVQGILGAVIMGAVTSAIVALFVRRKPRQEPMV